MNLTVRTGLLAVFSVLFLLEPTRADVGGRITGAVKDPTGSVIPGATVVAVNTVTGVKQTRTTDEQGNYAFPVLPIGQYEIDITAAGFKPNKTGGLAVDINAALIADVTLQLSDQNVTVTVTENGTRVETSDTQLGQGSKANK